jgi:hypothetical protein
MNKLICSLFLAVALVVANVHAQDEEVSIKPARLLIDKRVVNDILVEGQELKINYKIYNVGDK